MLYQAIMARRSATYWVLIGLIGASPSCEPDLHLEVGERIRPQRMAERAGPRPVNSLSPPASIIANRGGLIRLASFREDEFGVFLWTTEVQGSEFYRSEATVPTSFAVTTLEARYPDQLFVAGVDLRTGETVIEKWDFHAATGALAGSMFTAETGIGIPIPLHWPRVAPVGGVFIPPAQRSMELPPTKFEVYRGKGLSEISRMTPDPEGRFLLVQLKKNGSIFQMVPGAAPQLMVDAESSPNVLHMSLTSISQLGFDDRVFRLFDPTNFTFGVLHDPENDGIFRPLEILTYEELSETFPMEPYGDYRSMR